MLAKRLIRLGQGTAQQKLNIVMFRFVVLHLFAYVLKQRLKMLNELGQISVRGLQRIHRTLLFLDLDVQLLEPKS